VHTPKDNQKRTLDRVLSKFGVGSRTEARSWIGAGRVTVNGKKVQTPDVWIDPEQDRIELDGHPLTARLQGFGRVDYSYTGRQGTQFSPLNPIYNVVPAYNLLGARIGVRTDTWEAALFGKNLLNAYAVNILEEASNLTPRAVVPLQPLTFGLELRYHF